MPRLRWRPAGWALGLPALCLLTLLAILRVGPAVENDIRRALIAAPGADPSAALARLRARAEVDGRDVRIVADLGLPDEARRSLEGAVSGLRGVRSVAFAVAEPVRTEPFVFTARRESTGILLLGGTPSADLRAALVEAATAIVAAESVDDRLRLALGAPPGFDAAARFALSALARMSSGEVRLVDRTIAVGGVVEDDASYDSLLAALRSLPAGFAAGVGDIAPPLAPHWVWSARRTDNGLVLGGFVPSERDRAQLVAAAGLALPGAPVRDEMRTARGLAPSVDFGALGGAAVRALAMLQVGSATLEGETFAIAGETVERARVAETVGAMRRELPKAFGSSDIRLTVVPAKPFRFVARRALGQVVLSGYVPDEAGRRTTLEWSRARFPGERVVDQLAVADGEPALFGQAQRTALDALGDFAEGEAVLRDTTLRLSGRILYRQLADRMRQTFPGSAPPGWTAEISVETAPVARPLDAAFCQDLLGDALRRDPILFEPNSSRPSGSLAQLSDIVGRCGPALITVTHRIATPTDLAAAQRMADARAAAIVQALGGAGSPVRLAAAGIATSGRPDARTDMRVER